MSITIYASGSQTAVISTEHFLSSPNVAGDFALTLDLNNMAANDVLEVRAYKMAIAGGTQRLLWFHAFYGVQPDYAKNALSEWITNALTDTNALRFSIKQTFGTGRVYDWSVTQSGGDDYAAKVWLADDNSGAADRYIVQWFKNTVPLTSNNTTAIQVVKAADGTDLVASTNMTHVANGLYRYNETTNRIASGAVYGIKISATIDGASRTWVQPISRDS